MKPFVKQRYLKISESIKVAAIEEKELTRLYTFMM